MAIWRGTLLALTGLSIIWGHSVSAAAPKNNNPDSNQEKCEFSYSSAGSVPGKAEVQYIFKGTKSSPPMVLLHMPDEGREDDLILSSSYILSFEGGGWKSTKFDNAGPWEDAKVHRTTGAFYGELWLKREGPGPITVVAAKRPYDKPLCASFAAAFPNYLSTTEYGIRMDAKGRTSLTLRYQMMGNEGFPAAGLGANDDASSPYVLYDLNLTGSDVPVNYWWYTTRPFAIPTKSNVLINNGKNFPAKAGRSVDAAMHWATH